MNNFRQEVYRAIDSERNYQDKKWGLDRATSGGKHSPEEFLLYMEDYIDEARRFTSRHSCPAGPTFVLHTMRKLAAMAIACMEQNGVAYRAVEGDRPEGTVQ